MIPKISTRTKVRGIAASSMLAVSDELRGWLCARKGGSIQDADGVAKAPGITTLGEVTNADGVICLSLRSSRAVSYAVHVEILAGTCVSTVRTFFSFESLRGVTDASNGFEGSIVRFCTSGQGI